MHTPRKRVYVRTRRRYTYTRVRARRARRGEERRDDEGGRTRDEGGSGGMGTRGGERGVITDDCPLLRHGQSTARNPVHSAGFTRNDDSPGGPRCALDRARWLPQRREVDAGGKSEVKGREERKGEERTRASPKSAGDTRTTRSARDYAVDRFEEAGVSRGAR